MSALNVDDIIFITKTVEQMIGGLQRTQLAWGIYWVTEPWRRSRCWARHETLISYTPYAF